MENKNPQNIPADILKAIESADVYTKIEKIGNRYGLLLDQLGEINMYTEQLMIGKMKSADFVPTIARAAEISQTTAEKIATDINTEILASVRESLRKMQEIAESNAANPIEKAANITLVKPPVSNSPQYNDSTLKKEAVLNDLENIKNMRPENAPNFVEHLLANRVATPQKTEVQTETKPEIKKPAPTPPPRPAGIDPYREPIQ